MPEPKQIEVVAPNLKRRLSGVTATVVRLIPVQARMIGIVATGPGLPPELPHIPLTRAATLPRDRWRVWHARRNTEMALGLILRHVLRRRYRLLFTSAAQRRHTGFTRWLIHQQDALIAAVAKANPKSVVVLETGGARVDAVEVRSPHVLNAKGATYAQSADWGVEEAEGFIKLYGMSSTLWATVNAGRDD